MFFFDEDGAQRSLPRGWTDAGEVDLFVAMARGRSALRVGDLLDLADLIDGLRGRSASDDVYGDFVLLLLVRAGSVIGRRVLLYGRDEAGAVSIFAVEVSIACAA